MARRPAPRILPLLLMGLLVLVFVVFAGRERSGGSNSPPEAGEARILAAYEARESGVWVESAGEVSRLLADDNQGSRHQRFLLRLPSEHSLLISHNIDLADRIQSLSPGDRVGFRGEYEWNERGGLIHWTHHDPRGRREGGWLDHEGRRYR